MACRFEVEVEVEVESEVRSWLASGVTATSAGQASSPDCSPSTPAISASPAPATWEAKSGSGGFELLRP